MATISEVSNVHFSEVTGLSLFFFDWWYAKAGFTLAFFAVFTFCLFIHQIRFRTILLGSLMFVLFAYPITFMEGTVNVQYFLKGYFDFGEAKESVVNVRLTNPASFPNAMATISEVSNVHFSEGTGLSLFFFDWWYAKAGFTLAFFAVFTFCLFIHQIRFRTILLGSLMFV
jgi:hypothetical protein